MTTIIKNIIVALIISINLVRYKTALIINHNQYSRSMSYSHSSIETVAIHFDPQARFEELSDYILPFYTQNPYSRPDDPVYDQALAEIDLLWHSLMVTI